MIDAHVHTSLSDDSQCPMEAYWALLEDGTARGIGFADHWHPGIEAYRLQYPGYERKAFDNEAYRQKIEEGRAKGYRLYRGIELTYEKQWHEVCMQGVQAQRYDYIIASTHTFGGLWITRDYWTNLETVCFFLDDGAICPLFARPLNACRSSTPLSLLTMPTIPPITFYYSMPKRRSKIWKMKSPWRERRAAERSSQ